MRRFNVTGLCVPEEDYMVYISGKVEQIRKLVDNRCYFTINRARQYGKTTTLACLERALQDDYLVASISFQGIGDESFESPKNFCQVFLKLVSNALMFTDAHKDYSEGWLDMDVATFPELSDHVTEMCMDKKVVLMIDEVDKTSNNRVFLHFLGLLRQKFLDRKNRRDHTFHSVILAGVYDIKNIKLKIASEETYASAPTEERTYNSPWNVAVDFEVDMSFSPEEIATMLTDYESDNSTGMDIPAVSEEIYSYTSGYPFLVTRICQCLDEDLDKNWTIQGVRDAVQNIISKRNMLFDDLFKNLENNKSIYVLINDILILGKRRTYAIGSPAVDTAEMYGIIREKKQSIAVSNKVFEMVICNYLIAKNEDMNERKNSGILQHDVVNGGSFDMALCLRKFADHYNEVWNERDAEFLEREGRLLFLSYLKPLINGQGFYHIESQFTDLRRMDIVVDFGGEQFIVELKLWRGEAGHEKAYEQLLCYMESKGVVEGYLLTFDFRKGVNKQPYAKWVEFDRVRIFDVVV